MLMFLVILAMIVALLYVERNSLKRNVCNKIKGKLFEVEVKNLILKYFPDAKIINNIIIKNHKYSKEFDLIVMTKKEFFIVEAKNYNSCRITGEINDQNWTGIYNTGNKHKFYNPIFQAESGVRTLNKHLSNIHFKKMVVFSNSCNLSENIAKHKDVYSFSEFEKKLVDIKRGLDVYSDKYIESVYCKINSLETVTKAEHLRNIKEIKKNA